MTPANYTPLKVLFCSVTWKYTYSICAYAVQWSHICEHHKSHEAVQSDIQNGGRILWIWKHYIMWFYMWLLCGICLPSTVLEVLDSFSGIINPSWETSSCLHQNWEQMDKRIWSRTKPICIAGSLIENLIEGRDHRRTRCLCNRKKAHLQERSSK